MAAFENGDNPSHLVETPGGQANPVRYIAFIRQLNVYVHAGNVNELLSPADGSPLHYAVRLSDIELARILLRNGADINLRGGYAGESPLLLSCTRSVTFDSNKIFHLLLESGADVNARNSDGVTPLHVARFHSQVKQLLERGADVNARDSTGRTPLDENLGRFLLREDHLIVKELLLWGAKIDKRHKIVVFRLMQDTTCSMELFRRVFQGTGLADIRDAVKRTPLHCAVRAGHVELVRLLLDCGASVEAWDSLGYMPLHTAVARSDTPLYRGVEVVSELIRKGADLNGKTDCGLTPLHLAFFLSKNEAMVELLLSAGADIDVLRIWPSSTHPGTPLFLKYSFLRNYTYTLEYAEIASCENIPAYTQCIVEIRDMRRTRLSKDLTLYDVAFGDKWDFSCARKVYEYMSSGEFPMYSKMALTKLAQNAKKHLSDNAINNSLFLHHLSRKSSFRANQHVLLEIVKYLSDEDCLNLCVASC